MRVPRAYLSVATTRPVLFQLSKHLTLLMVLDSFNTCVFLHLRMNSAYSSQSRQTLRKQNSADLPMPMINVRVSGSNFISSEAFISALNTTDIMYTYESSEQIKAELNSSSAA